jgi:hypothetical protein
MNRNAWGTFMVLEGIAIVVGPRWKFFPDPDPILIRPGGGKSEILIGPSGALEIGERESGGVGSGAWGRGSWTWTSWQIGKGQAGGARGAGAPRATPSSPILSVTIASLIDLARLS